VINGGGRKHSDSGAYEGAPAGPGDLKLKDLVR
jgi:hypothetical protein